MVKLVASTYRCSSCGSPATAELAVGIGADPSGTWNTTLCPSCLIEVARLIVTTVGCPIERAA